MSIITTNFCCSILASYFKIHTFRQLKICALQEHDQCVHHLLIVLPTYPFFKKSFKNSSLYKLYALPLYCSFVSNIFLALFTNSFLTYPYDILCKGRDLLPYFSHKFLLLKVEDQWWLVLSQNFFSNCLIYGYVKMLTGKYIHLINSTIGMHYLTIKDTFIKFSWGQ